MSAATVTGIVQIGVLVRNVDDAVLQYAKLLGINDWNINHVDTDTGQGRNFRAGSSAVAVKAKIAWTTLGGIELELIEPRDTSSVYAQYLAEHGPGIHHVLFDTHNYESAVRGLKNHGVERILSGELQATRFQVFDMRNSLGLICEFAEGDPLQPDEPVGS